MIKKYSVKEINDVVVLHVNDKPAQCPFRNPYPTPNILTSRVDFNVPICSNDCQFFNYVSYGDNFNEEQIETVFLDCCDVSKIVNR
jgi:hypothetical protein